MILTIQFRVIKFNIFVVLSFAPSYVLTQYLLNAYARLKNCNNQTSFPTMCHTTLNVT